MISSSHYYFFYSTPIWDWRE